MRTWQVMLPVLAAAGVTAAAAADPKVFVPIGSTDEMVIVVEATSGLQPHRGTTRAVQLVYYASPGFSFEGVPIRMTRTEYDIDCDNGQSRRVRASAFRDIGDRVGEENYSEPWTPIAGGAMDTTRRLACNGLGPNDVVFESLNSAINGTSGLLRAAAAG